MIRIEGPGRTQFNKKPVIKSAQTRFSGKSDHKTEAARAEAREMRGIGTNELLLPDLFMGHPRLGMMSGVDWYLSPNEQRQIDAYKKLVQIGLRSKRAPQTTHGKLLREVEQPTPEMAAWMEKLNIAPHDFKTPVVDAHQIDEDNDVPPEVHDRMVKLGLNRLKLPKEYGGLGFKQRQYAETLSVFPDISATLGSIISAHNTIGSAPLIQFGSPAQKAKYIPEIAKGDYYVAFGLTEPLAGTDLRKLSTTAELSPDGKKWVLNGEKIFITNIPDAGLAYLVSGSTKIKGETKGPSVFVVQLPFRIRESWADKKKHFQTLAKQGMVITPFTRKALEMMDIRGSDQAYIQLKNFEVPAENVLGEIGKGKIVPLASLNHGRAAFGPLTVTAAEQLATQATQHAVDRKMFDMYRNNPARSGEQADMKDMKLRLGKMHVDAVMTRAFSDLVSGLLDAYPDHQVAGLSALVKVMATDANWDNASENQDIHGGMGMIKGAPNGVERNTRDARIPRLVEGHNKAMTQLPFAVDASLLQAMMNAGKKELVRRVKGLPTRVVVQGKNLVTGRWSEMKRIHRENSIFTIPAFQKFAEAQFTRELGDLSKKEAKWYRSRIRKFSRNFGMLAMRKQEALAQEQPYLLRTSGILQNMLRVVSAQIKLAKYGDRLEPQEKQLLKYGIEIYKNKVDEEFKYMNLKGKPGEREAIAAGQVAIDFERARQGERENTEAIFLAFLRQRAEAFHQSLEEVHT